MNKEGKLGLVQMFWGDGKGKTTAALGMGLRAAGWGLRVHMIQFFKGGTKKEGVTKGKGTEERAQRWEYGELRALKCLENFTTEQFGISGWIIGEPTKEQKEAILKALEASAKALSSGDYDMVILDESLYAVSLGVISTDDLIKIIKDKAPNTEVVLTGSQRRIPQIEAIADLVTEVRKIKHPFDKGIKARRGTEF